jgi:hypothetical protein
VGWEGEDNPNKPSLEWSRLVVAASLDRNYRAIIQKKKVSKIMSTEIITTTSTAIYVPFGGQRVNLGNEAVTPAPEYPLLQYATGLPAQRPRLNEKGQQVIDEDTGEVVWDSLYYAGFFTQHGKDKDLDDAMRKHGFQWIEISHGGGEVVRHWMLERPALFLMADGVPSIATTNGKFGIVYQWRQKRNSSKSETVLYAQVIIRQLLPDYDKPFVFTVKSTQTADALGAMRKQYKVLSAAHDVLRGSGSDMALPLWSYSAIFGASKKQEQRGQGANSKTIFPMLCGIPDAVPVSYLQKHEVPVEHIEHFRECTQKAVEWAEALSQRIASDIETHEPWKQGSGSDVSTEDHPF